MHLIVRPTTHIKGPDVMSKSVRTRQRYAKAFAGQTRLDTFFGNSQQPTSSSTVPQARRVSDRSISSKETARSSDGGESDKSDEIIDIQVDTPANNHPSPGRNISVAPSVLASELMEHAPDNPSDKELSDKEPEPLQNPQDAETWEEELEEDISSNPTKIKDWPTLRAQIKADLKKHSRKLPLSEINKLMIICNFATLWIKGQSRHEASLEIAAQWQERDGIWFSRRVHALARHYQLFEQLPKKRCGGLRSVRSLLSDELVKKQVVDYLQSLQTGKVTPKKLQVAVNTEILPKLGITPKKPIGTRTACCWLIKFGWRYTQVKKGVYMDGHERADVVNYRQETFLPLMAKFEARMVHYEGPELRHVAPTLEPGEREIIPNFHDESSFHGNNEARNLWLRKG